jgi:hypothetical protein
MACDRADLEEGLARARDALGDTAYDADCGEVRAMAMEEADAYALGEPAPGRHLDQCSVSQVLGLCRQPPRRAPALRCAVLATPGRFNGPRRWLTIRALSVPYDPFYNGFVYRGGCP